MLIILRYPVRSMREAVNFERAINLAELPSAGDEIDVAEACEPVRVVAVNADAVPPIIDVEAWDEPAPEDRALELEYLEGLLADLVDAGWKRVEPKNRSTQPRPIG